MQPGAGHRQGGWLSLAALRQPLCCPPYKPDLPARFFSGGSVLVGLELGVVVRELVVQDGDGHAVEDDAEGDAGQSQDAAQVGLREHVTVADRGNAHLNQRAAQRLASKRVYPLQGFSWREFASNTFLGFNEVLVCGKGETTLPLLVRLNHHLIFQLPLNIINHLKVSKIRKGRRLPLTLYFSDYIIVRVQVKIIFMYIVVTVLVRHYKHDED